MNSDPTPENSPETPKVKKYATANIYRHGNGTLRARVNPSPEMTFSEACKYVKTLLGSSGRIWRVDGGFAIGVDQKPGRAVFAQGPTPREAVAKLIERASHD